MSLQGANEDVAVNLNRHAELDSASKTTDKNSVSLNLNRHAELDSASIATNKNSKILKRVQNDKAKSKINNFFAKMNGENII